MNLGPDLPTFESTQSALRRTTEHLAHDLHAPAQDAPDWTAFEWSVARAVCTLHGISGLLANRLRWRGPDSWTGFLEQQHQQSVARDARIGALLSSIDAAARTAGIGTVALKGSALRPKGWYAPGERPQADVDLLVDAAVLPAWAASLESIGYACAGTTQRHAIFEPRTRTSELAFGEHPANPLKVEVHTHIAESLPVTPIDITTRLAAPDLAPGINSYRDDVALFLHLALHTAANMRAHALRMVQLRDIGLVARQLGPPHWNELANLPPALGGSWWLAAPLSLVERYHPGTIPQGLLEALWPGAPRALRRALARQQLTDVSWSNLRIHALPGIEWARSPLEALRFARSRIAPTRRARADLALSVGGSATLRASQWYAASHWKRIVRYVTAPPARVQTVASLSAALAPNVTELEGQSSWRPS